ncbi:MAG: nuclear transport factor 2 family protein [Stellaceae bacterium]
MDGNVELLKHIYNRFNARDIDAVLVVLAYDVAWANGMDGGHVHGREAVREYWTKQWAVIQPQVDPLRITNRSDGTMAVEVHQVVHDLKGKLLLDEAVRHVFRIEDDLITRFDIENAGGLSSIPHA